MRRAASWFLHLRTRSRAPIIEITLTKLYAPPLQVCWTKYGSYPIHRPYCHESAVRILLACIEQHANRWGGVGFLLLGCCEGFGSRVRGTGVGVRGRPNRCRCSVAPRI
jgi:tRNA G26 N,N-dimethylase Trm1